MLQAPRTSSPLKIRMSPHTLEPGIASTMDFVDNNNDGDNDHDDDDVQTLFQTYINLVYSLQHNSNITIPASAHLMI